MKVTTEHELKLDVPEGFQLPPLEGAALAPRAFTSVYHDTEDASLARAGITLRRRVENGVALWQLKLPADDSRLELEQAGGPTVPEDFERLLAAHLRHGSLAPVAELRTRRTGVLVDADGTRAEVALDEVQVMDSRRVASVFAEVEVELQGGEAGGLRSIARSLRQAGAHDASGIPKLFRALDFEPDGLGPGLRGAAQRQLREILAHDPGTRLGEDPESLHQHRVAVRRLRAFLRTARPLLEPEQAEQVEALREELSWLGSVLAPVRDLDVMLEHLQDEIASLGDPDAREAAPLLKALNRGRARARRTLLTALGSKRYFALLDETERVAGGLPVARAELPRLARKEFRKLSKAVAAAGPDPDDETLHALRIRGKRARYAAELATPRVGAPADEFVSRAKRFQDVLGTHQDTVVIEGRLRELVEAQPTPAQLVAAGRLIERERARRAESRAAWPRAWKKLDRAGRNAWAK